MANAKVVTGARCSVAIFDPATNTSTIVGIFNNVSYGLTYTADPIYVLGSTGPVETVYTSQDAVHVSASGWRVVGAGAHISAKLPKLQELLTSDYISLTIYDRLSDATKPIAKISQVRALSYNTTLSNRSASEISVNFIGIHVSDESVDNAEGADSSMVKSGAWASPP
jgi:hypothetical protein